MICELLVYLYSIYHYSQFTLPYRRLMIGSVYIHTFILCSTFSRSAITLVIMYKFISLFIRFFCNNDAFPVQRSKINYILYSFNVSRCYESGTGGISPFVDDSFILFYFISNRHLII